MNPLLARLTSVVVIFGAVFGGISYMEYLKHVERVECIKAGGSPADKTCIRNQVSKP